MPPLITRNPTAFVLTLLTILIGVLQWLIREQPFVVGPVRIDGLSLFFGFALLLGVSCAAFEAKTSPRRSPDVRIHINLKLLVLAFVIGVLLVARSTLAIGLLCLFISLLASLPLRLAPRNASRRQLFQSAVTRAPLLLAGICVAIAYGALGLRGATFYDDPLAGAALDSFVFWFILLGTALPLVSANAETSRQRDRKTRRQGDERTSLDPSSFIFHPLVPTLQRFAASPLLLYPLVRLYTLGPWNSGWSLAAALLGGALALWAAWHFLMRLEIHFAWTALLGLGLACFGLATSAGIASGCFLVLVATMFAYGTTADDRRPRTDDDVALLELLLLAEVPAPQKSSAFRSFAPSLLRFSLFAAPLMAIWMAIGAAIAGGVSALAGVAWLVGLLSALAMMLRSKWYMPTVRQVVGYALTLGAPFLLQWLVEPVVLQLQGGLTPYGDVLIWPWIGLAFVNSAQAQVAVLPSIAVVLLLIVLVAMVYLLARLRDEEATTPFAGGTNDFGWLWRAVRDEVPWLGERRRSDAE